MRAPDKIVLLSMALTGGLGLVEVGLWSVFGLLVFLAAGLDALFDTFTSLCVWVGLRVSRRPADRNHQYGHGQAEMLVSLLLSCVLILAAVRIILLSFQGSEPAEPPVWLLLVAGVTIPLFSILGITKLRIGREWDNPSVVADGYHTLSDALASILVLTTIVFVRMGRRWMDALSSFFISLLLMYWGICVGREAVGSLMGEAPKDFTSEVRKACLGVRGVRSYHRCRARKVGSKIYADLHLQVDPSLSVEKAHEVASEVERRLKRRMPGLSSVVVHVEPSKRWKKDVQ
ncbi:MAG: cation diffusion facilitator family transporter [Candidatus Hadarchaeales archaeon]